MANGSEPPPEPWDAVRRTRLAAERTELAWWRTALTSIAIAGYGSIRSRRVERAVDMGR